MKIKKKFLAVVLSAACVFSLIPAMAASASDMPINVTIDGQQVYFSDRGPVTVGGSVLAPARDVFGQLGFAIYWYSEHRQVVLRNDDYVVVLTLGSNVFYTNGVGCTLDVPPQLMGRSAMLPIREVLESVGFFVEWEHETWTVLIMSDIGQPVEPAPPYNDEENEYEPPYEPDSNEFTLEIKQFGGYDWRVLDMQDGRLLLLSEYAIFERKFHNAFEAVTWETSEIRRYLNREFFGRFSAEDQARIARTVIINDDNPWFGVNGGRVTADRIFLLSIEEVVRFFGDSGELDDPIDRSMIHGYRQYRWVQTLEGHMVGWWLRSPGHFPMSAGIVRIDGSIIVSGVSVDNAAFSLYARPALWLYW